jgi:hypothetical protein
MFRLFNLNFISKSRLSILFIPLLLASCSSLTPFNNADGSFVEPLKDKDGNKKVRITFPDTRIFIGQLEKGLMSGDGKLVGIDESVYQGQFSKGKRQGLGTLTWKDGSSFEGQFDNDTPKSGTLTAPLKHTYTGEFKNSVFDGQGEILYENGNYYVGEFKYGQLQGQGILTTPQGDVYSGQFKQNALTGNAEITYSDGSIYVGTTQKWRFHGKGKFTNIDGSIKEGLWKNGQLSRDLINQYRANEKTMYLQSKRLASELTALKTSEKNDREYYFLGLAASAQNTVFYDELNIISNTLIEKNIPRDQQILLANHKPNPTEMPLVTRYSMRQALNTLSKKMQDDDFLIIYLSSHGGRNHSLQLSQPEFPVYSVDKNEMVNILNEFDISPNLVIISACFSGGFIEPLSTNNRAVFTASSATTSSFGCSDDTDMTWFGRALFETNIGKMNNLDAWITGAKDTIQSWEADKELPPSDPQSFISPYMNTQWSF